MSEGVSEGIRVQGLWKRFGSFEAVRDVGFEAEDGKITALLRSSGSGKSTVLRMIAGLERPDAGRIWVGGEEQTGKSVQERRFGFVFQHYALFRHMTVSRNVAFGLSVRRESRAAQHRRVGELLELVGLTAFANRYPDQLSGGQRQRVALARALAPQPRLLLLDEPFGALDARVRQELRRWLDDLHRELGVTSLLVTHDQEEALELANEVVVMHRGRVEQIGTADEVYKRPATPFVAGFVGTANVVHGEVTWASLRRSTSGCPTARCLWPSFRMRRSTGSGPGKRCSPTFATRRYSLWRTQGTRSRTRAWRKSRDTRWRSLGRRAFRCARSRC